MKTMSPVIAAYRATRNPTAPYERPAGSVVAEAEAAGAICNAVGTLCWTLPLLLAEVSL